MLHVVVGVDEIESGWRLQLWQCSRSERRQRCGRTGGQVSYPVFMLKPSTHRMHDPRSIVPHIQSKVLTDNQMS
jgi:hypothetical protein